jgi:hypothetical protein
MVATSSARSVLLAQTESDYKCKTEQFVIFKNVLRVMYKRMPFADIFSAHGNAVTAFDQTLKDAAAADAALAARLDDLERDARAIALAGPLAPFTYTVMLFEDLSMSGDWPLLRMQAERHVNSSDSVLALAARRMLALSLAHSDDETDKAAAVVLYQALIGDATAQPKDFGNLATLLAECSRVGEAKTVIMDGARRFSGNETYFSEIGAKLIAATGDREFRDELDSVLGAR